MIKTQSLLKAAQEAAKPNSTSHHAIVSSILAEHLDIAGLKNPEIQRKLKLNISDEWSALEKLLDSLPKTGNVPPQTEDKILSVGEKLSARYLAALLEDHGIPAQYLDLSDIIQRDAGPPLNQAFYQSLAKAMGRRIELCGDKVPVWQRHNRTLLPWLMSGFAGSDWLLRPFTWGSTQTIRPWVF